MHVSSACPLSVATLVWQPRPGAFALTVICKATYTLQPGKSSLAATQDAPFQADLPWEEAAPGSLRASTDRVPFKRHVDVLVGGHAHAPPGQPAASLVARLVVGGLDKAIDVHGDRFWGMDGRLSAALPFTRMPLRWERTAGGPGTWNPLGMAASAPSDARGRRPVPNLLPAGFSLRSPDQVIPPASFGPLAPTFPERVAKLRRHGVAFRHHAWAEQPLPEDVDAAYFNAAPPDQQLLRIAVEEELLLEHLHPEHARLSTVLDRVIPHALVQRGQANPEEIRLRCDTLWIDADRGTCALTWRGVVPLRHPAEEGVVIVTADLPGGVGVEGTLVSRASGSGAQSVWPFLSRPPVAGTPLPFQAVLPSQPPKEEAMAPIPTSEPPISEDSTAPLGPVTKPAGAGALPVLPFVEPPKAEAPAATHAPVALADTALPFKPLATAMPASPPPAEPAPLPAKSEPPAPLPAKSEPPAPPPLLGPLLTLSLAKEAGAKESAPSPTAMAVEEKELPLEAYPIERCAAIAARIAREAEDLHAILEAEGLREERWPALHAHWLSEIQAEAARGKKALLAAYDAAYVRALEEARGPIGAAEYAEMVIAAERGGEEVALAEMGLPAGTMMRIRRVWLERIVKDRKAAAELRAAMRAAAEG